jgi:CRP-like cAMP-binding protein
MTTLQSLATPRTLVPGEELILQGAAGGALYILVSGELSVERDGVAITTITARNALVGEMSVLLGTPNSATVRAVGPATVRALENAREYLMEDAELTFRLAALVASRLDATTALLVDLSKHHPAQQGLLARILSAIHLQSDEAIVTRHDLFE